MNNELPTFTWAGAMVPASTDWTKRQHRIAMVATGIFGVVMTLAAVINL